VDATLPGPIKVSKKGKFDVAFEQPVYGNLSHVKGKFDGKKLTGKLQLDAHYPATDVYPEEDCVTGVLEFKAKRGAPDETNRQRALHEQSHQWGGAVPAGTGSQAYRRVPIPREGGGADPPSSNTHFTGGAQSLRSPRPERSWPQTHP
jgi:hypothetical protein